MLEFNIKFDKKPKKILLKYPDILKHECLFEILINDIVIFKEPNFPIYEFYIQLKKWILEKMNYNYDFVYNSIESDLNPLITISYCNELWKFKFLWDEFESDELVSSEELINAVGILESKIL